MILDDFEYITGYDLRGYFVRFIDFSTYKYPNIVKYYRGEVDSPDPVSFNTLNSLLKESIVVNGVIESNRKSLSSNAEFWELLIQVETIRTKLESMENTARWERSVKSNVDYSKYSDMTIILKQSQTLENISRAIGNESSNDGWYSIAISNDLHEEGYDLSGGNEIKIFFRDGVPVIISDVVDIMNGDNIYGKDIYKVITFEDDDLKSLDPKDAVQQCLDTLVSIRRGSVPEYPEFGIRNIAGSNIMSIAYPIISRQLRQTIMSDSVVMNVTVSNIEIYGDAVKISAVIKTKLSDEIIKEITI